MEGFVHWAAREAESSPGFHAGVDRLRRLAAGEQRSGYPRSTGTLTGYSWGRLEQMLSASARQAEHERPRAWRNSPLPTDDGLRHLRTYLRGCRTLARRFLGSEQVAPLVHDLVCREGYRVSSPANAANAAAPTGARASALAAHISGASFGAGATAHRVRWHRRRPGDQLPGSSWQQPAPEHHRIEPAPLLLWPASGPTATLTGLYR